MALGKSESQAGRWFPYSYEVVIMIWTSFLVQQQASGDRNSSSAGTSSVHPSGADNDSDATMAEAASNSHRVAIACAPLLFEVIKQSLAYRVKMLTQKLRAEKDRCGCPPLAVLDDALQSTLERLISMITDACLDSRNFDSRDARQMSIDVNDSIVRFLRDMFGFLKPASAYRLVAVYLSRFVTKEGTRIIMDDEKKSIEISTKKGNKLLISDDLKGFVIEDENKNKISMNDQGITIESCKDFNVKATGNIKMEGVNVNAEGSGNMTLKGTMINLN